MYYVVPNLGSFIDSDLAMLTHARSTQGLRLFRQVTSASQYPSSVSTTTTWTFSSASKRYNSLPIYIQCQLESVLTSSAWLIYDLHQFDHISDALASLPRLRVPERMTAPLTFRALRGVSLQYLSETLMRVSSPAAVFAFVATDGVTLSTHCYRHSFILCSWSLNMKPATFWGALSRHSKRIYFVSLTLTILVLIYILLRRS